MRSLTPAPRAQRTVDAYAWLATGGILLFAVCTAVGGIVVCAQAYLQMVAA